MKLRILCFVVLVAAGPQIYANTDSPIDRSGKWDVNGNLGPSKTLDLSVDEGTWMNLDVHPDGSSIVFDLLGDLYVMPSTGGAAKRLTQGAAHDFQPRFSPDGKKILFTSDRDGINGIWTATFNGDSLSDLKNLNEKATTSFGGGAWSADGKWIFARKRVTDTSSIGISELWLFDVLGGSGVKVVSDGGEVDSFSGTKDQRYIYYGSSGPFSYGRDPYDTIWSIHRFDRKTGEKRAISSGLGGAASPVLSPDERFLAFVRRVSGKSTLWLHDLEDGSERQLWDGLDRDQMEAFGSHHIYPNYDWTPDGQSLVVWAGGKFQRVAVSDAEVETIGFQARIELDYHQPLRFKQSIAQETLRAKLIRWPVISPDGEALVFQALGHLYWMSLPDGKPTRVTDLEEFEYSPTFSPDGRRLVFTTWQDTDGGTVREVSWRSSGPSGRVSTLHTSSAQLVNPAFSRDGGKLLFVAGSGANRRGEELGGESRHDIFLLDLTQKQSRPTLVTVVSNRGANRRVTRPTFSADGNRVWFYDDEGGGGERGQRQPAKTALISTSLDGTDRKLHMQFRFAQEVVVSPDESLVAFTEQHNAYVTKLIKTSEVVDFDPNSPTLPFAQLSYDGGEWVGFSHDAEYLSWGFSSQVNRIKTAAIEFQTKLTPRDSKDHGVLILPITVNGSGGYEIDNDTLDLNELKQRLTPQLSNESHVRLAVTMDDAAPWNAWQALEGYAKSEKLELKLNKKSKDDSAAKNSSVETFTLDLTVPRATPSGVVAFKGARLITMRGEEVIDVGTVVVKDNRLLAVGHESDVTIPEDATVFDVAGKTIIPGLIDVHAHMGYAVLDVSPNKDWQYYANLAYGVTTTHDPSASTHTVFSQAEMVEAGVMIGPRIFSTGFILYGALTPDMAIIKSYADALSHVRRLKRLGAISVKSYVQPRREQRQWLIRAAAAEKMLVMPEGAGDFPANIGMLLDGHSGIEHALSVGEIYQDVIQLFAQTRSGYTGTLLVAYGGQEGENWFYQHHDVWEDEKLQSFYPPRYLESRSRRREMSPEEDYNHKLVAYGQKQIDDAGGLITLGAHGQLQGLGAHWELWAIAHGGMKPHAALKVATINGAEYLGMDSEIGSLETGKLADFVVLDKNPLEKIEHTNSVRTTIVNGFVYDAQTMNQVWPTQAPRGRFYFEQ